MLFLLQEEVFDAAQAASLVLCLCHVERIGIKLLSNFKTSSVDHERVGIGLNAVAHLGTSLQGKMFFILFSSATAFLW